MFTMRKVHNVVFGWCVGMQGLVALEGTRANSMLAQNICGAGWLHPMLLQTAAQRRHLHV